jgi:hypothetical protein
MRMISERIGWILVPAAALALLWATPLGASSGRPANGPAKGPSAGGAVRPAATGVRIAGASVGSRSTSILGAAWNVDNSPLKQANLRLRNVVTGQVAGLMQANDAGQFAFENIEPGSYAVELLSDAGKIQTVGHVFTIASGETVATFVRLGTKVPWGSAFFSNTASAVASSAASQGITALTPLGRCVSPPGCSH